MCNECKVLVNKLFAIHVCIAHTCVYIMEVMLISSDNFFLGMEWHTSYTTQLFPQKGHRGGTIPLLTFQPFF